MAEAMDNTVTVGNLDSVPAPPVTSTLNISYTTVEDADEKIRISMEGAAGFKWNRCDLGNGHINNHHAICSLSRV